MARDEREGSSTGVPVTVKSCFLGETKKMGDVRMDDGNDDE